jgi:7,8-dihydropterin-6-yl-methyl-4-(beta-D-ribofuranosyl)aminobenzene 5'-phosphate synthase
MSASFAVAAAAGGFSCVEMAEAGPIEVPTVDKLSVRVLVDSASDIFCRPPADRCGVPSDDSGQCSIPRRPW